MGSENDEQLSPMELVETKKECPKKAKVTYSKKVLLSLSELEVCSKLPRGFDSSILTEFDKAVESVPERPKNPGGLSSQNSARGDSGNLSQESNGRWSNRFSVLSDKNSHSRLDLESDCGKSYGNPSRRTWQNAEQDGLLGTGSSKPSKFTNASDAEIRESAQYQLSKSDQPYKPPRPCKAASHSWKHVTDTKNAHTFGSSEISNQGRAEEEKRRRESFEQFRKEHKPIHETQKSLPHKENVDPDVAAMDDKNIKVEDTIPNILLGDSFRCSLTAQTLASRPLAPPGFTRVAQEKKIGDGEEVKSSVTVNGNSDSVVDKKSLPHVDLGEQEYEIKTVHAPLTDINEKSVMGIASPECSMSILDKLFSKASLADSGFSNFSKLGDANADTGSSIPFQSFKFPGWYPQEEKRPETKLSSGKPKDLLSLVLNCEKDGSQVSRVSDVETSILPLGSSDLTHRSGTTTSCTVAILEPPYQSENSGASQGVLTCKDLEQSILSQFTENNSRFDQSFESSGSLNGNTTKRPEVDSTASQHLLSLLKKGTSVNDSVQSDIHEALTNHLYKPVLVNSVQNSTLEDFGKVAKSEADPTLEMLLGKAFMKELQSVKAPVSGQCSVGGITQNNQTTLAGDSVSNLIQQMKSIKDEDVSLGFDASQDKFESNHNNISAEDRAVEALGIQFPDEESLITYDAVGNTSEADLLCSSSALIDIIDKIAVPNANATSEKERSSVSLFDDPSIICGTYKLEEPEILYQNRHGHLTSQFAHPQMNCGSTLQPTGSYPSHMNIPSKVMGIENAFHPEFPQPNYPPNVLPSPFQNVNGVPPRFSHPAQPPILQQMHTQGNMPLPHPPCGWPSVPPLPPYAINPMCVYMCQPNIMQNLPFHHQQNYNTIERPIQGHAAGGCGNIRPKAPVKWNQKERRTNFRPIRPTAR